MNNSKKQVGDSGLTRREIKAIINAVDQHAKAMKRLYQAHQDAAKTAGLVVGYLDNNPHDPLGRGALYEKIDTIMAEFDRIYNEMVALFDEQAGTQS